MSDPIVAPDIYEDGLEALEVQMPVAPWSRKFYHQTATDGVEVMLVRRKSGNVWVVLTPDLEAESCDLTQYAVIPLRRAAAFPQRVAGNSYVFGTVSDARWQEAVWGAFW